MYSGFVHADPSSSAYVFSFPGWQIVRRKKKIKNGREWSQHLTIIFNSSICKSVKIRKINRTSTEADRQVPKDCCCVLIVSFFQQVKKIFV